MHVLYKDPDLGRIVVPKLFQQALSYPGRATHRAVRGEVGIVVAKQRRPRVDGWTGLLAGYDLLWESISHNERTDAGAAQQAVQVFSGGSTPATPSTTLFPHVIAVANATLTKAQTDKSLGVVTLGVTTSEFTSLGLTRVAATSPIGGDYSVPGSLGGTFQQIVKKTFTASGGATATGSGIFDNVTVATSVLYVEDNFGSNAVLVTNDTLAITWTITN